MKFLIDNALPPMLAELLEALPEVARVLDAVQPAAVDYSALQNPGGTVSLIENLVNLEMHDSKRSQAVIFVGPKSIYKNKPSSQFGLPPGAKQRFFYVVCDPTRFLLPRSSSLSGGDWGAQGLAMGFPPLFPGGRIRPDRPDDLVWTNYGPNRGADSIEYTVDQLKGKTLHVDSPASFADAVDKRPFIGHDPVARGGKDVTP